MTRIVLTIFASIIVAIYGFGQCTTGKYSANGALHTPDGELKALIVYVKFNHPANAQSVTGWLPNVDFPDYVTVNQQTNEVSTTDFFFNKASDFNSSLMADPNNRSVSKILNQMSNPNKNFQMTVDIFRDANNIPISVEIDPTNANSWSTMNQRVINKMKVLNPSFDWSTFDNRTNNPQYTTDNSANPTPDNKPDFIIFEYRYNNNWATQPVSNMNNWDGSQGGFQPLAGVNTTYNGYNITTAGFTLCTGGTKTSNIHLFIHEWAHAMYDAHHFFGNNGVTSNHFCRPTGGWGSTATFHSYFQPMLNAWERWYLDYITPVSIDDENDLSTTGEYILQDFVTTGDAIRIQIPFSGGQYLWLENHTGQNNLDFHSYSGKPLGPNGTIVPDVDLGLYMYLEDYNNDKCNPQTNALTSAANGFHLINASGNHDFTISNNYVLNSWNNKLYQFTQQEENPLNGTNPLYYFLHDYDNSGTIGYNPNFVNGNDVTEGEYIQREWINGQDEYLYRGFGTAGGVSQGLRNSPSFSIGDKLGMGTNPTITNYQTYNNLTKELNGIFLNGLSIEVINDTSLPEGTIKVRIQFKEVEVDNDVRWTGKVHLPNITGNSQADLILREEKIITIDKSGTYNRHTKTTAGEFINSTNFIIQANSKMHLLESSTVKVQNGSTLTIEEDAEVILENDACIVIEDNSTLYLKGNNITLNGSEARILVNGGGTIKTDNGVDLTFTGNGYFLFKKVDGKQPLLDFGDDSGLKLTGTGINQRFMQLGANVELDLGNAPILLRNGKVNYKKNSYLFSYESEIRLIYSSFTQIDNPIKTATGIFAFEPTVFIVSDSKFKKLQHGFFVDGAAGFCFIQKNTFEENMQGIAIENSSMVTLRSNHFRVNDDCVSLRLVNHLNSHNNNIYDVNNYGFKLINSTLYSNGDLISDCLYGIGGGASDVYLRGGTEIKNNIYGVHLTNSIANTKLVVGDLSCASITDNSIAGVSGSNLRLEIDAEIHACNRGDCSDITPNTFDAPVGAKIFDICYNSGTALTLPIPAKGNNWNSSMPSSYSIGFGANNCSGIQLNSSNPSFSNDNCYPSNDNVISGPVEVGKMNINLGNTSLSITNNSNKVNSVDEEVYFDKLIISNAKIYPNPTSLDAILKYSLHTDSDIHITLLNTLGQRLSILNSGYQAAGEYQLKIERNNLPTGLYFCQIKVNESIQTIKFLIK